MHRVTSTISGNCAVNTRAKDTTNDTFEVKRGAHLEVCRGSGACSGMLLGPGASDTGPSICSLASKNATSLLKLSKTPPPVKLDTARRANTDVSWIFPLSQDQHTQNAEQQQTHTSKQKPEAVGQTCITPARTPTGTSTGPKTVCPLAYCSNALPLAC